LKKRDVQDWIKSLDIPSFLQLKYIRIFGENEITSMEQVVDFDLDMLHNFLGVRVGTALIMVDSIGEYKKSESLKNSNKLIKRSKEKK